MVLQLQEEVQEETYKKKHKNAAIDQEKCDTLKRLSSWLRLNLYDDEKDEETFEGG